MKNKIFILLFVLFFNSCTPFSVLSNEQKSNDNVTSQEDLLFNELEADFQEDFSDEDLLSEEGLIDDQDSSPERRSQVFDPIEPFNRAVFVFNDKVYTYVFTPVSKGYKKVTPKFVRTGIGNFFSNLASPLRIANNLLQGKFKNAGAETGKFCINTFLGFLGVIDSAKTIEALNPPSEDLGQTFGKWGIGSGPYIVLPFLGPSNLRDTVGMAGQMYLDPVNFAYDPSTDEKYLKTGIENLNGLPSKMELYKTLKDSSFDPYTAARDAYKQIRDEQIKK